MSCRMLARRMAGDASSTARAASTYAATKRQSKSRLTGGLVEILWPAAFIAGAVFMSTLVFAAARDAVADEGPAQTPVAEYPPPAMIEFFERQAKLMHLWQVLPPKAQPFCEQFQRDLASMHDITFVPPIVHVETLDDPALRKFTKSCPWIELNRIDVTSNLTYRVDSFFAQRDFELYHVNIEDNPNGKKKYVFLGNSYCLPSKPDVCMGSFYKVVDLRRCAAGLFASVPDPYDEGPRIGATKTKRGESAIILYHGKHYFLTGGYAGYGRDGDIDSLQLQTSRRDDKKTQGLICAFTPETLTEAQ